MTRYTYISCMLLFAAILAGCPPGQSTSVSLSINPLSIQLNIGQATTFTITSPVASDSFRWQSSQPAVAAVDNRGRVTAVGPGSTQITAISEINSARITATVTVAGDPAGLADVSVSPGEVTIAAGSTIALDATSTRESPSFLWFSEDETIARVDAGGVVTGVAPGTVTVVARGDTPEERATATITVVEATLTSVVVRPVEAGILTGGVIDLNVTSTDPEDTFEWRSDLVTTATVDEDGAVTGVGSGAVVIEARGSNSGAIGRAIISVNRPVEHKISVSPSTVTLAARDGIQLGANSTRPGDSITWSSEDPAIATVDSSGFVRGAGVGTANIFAQGTNPDERGTAMVRVVEGAVRIAAVRPLSASVPAGESIALSAESRDATEAFTWVSADPSTATVSPFGVVSGVEAGTVRITAIGANTGAVGSSLITVTEPVVHVVSVSPSAVAIEVGDTVSLAAASTRASEPILWESGNSAVATVDGNGAVTGAGAGTVVISATGSQSGVSAVATITVTEPVVQALVVRPLSASVAPEETLQLTAESTDPLDGFTWASADETIVAVNAAGLITGVAPGSVAITATGANSLAAASSTITVTAPVVHQVRVLPSAAAIEVADTVRLAASSTRVGDGFLWTTGDPAIATVDTTGLVTGTGPGTVMITTEGTLSGVQAVAAVTVSDPPPEEALVRPLEASILVGETVALNAETSESMDEFAWSSGEEAVAAVSETGVVTGAGAGTASITATGSVTGASGSSTIMVSEPVVHEVVISPSSASIFPDDTLQLNATTTREGDSFTWSTSSPAVVSVSAAGLVTGVGEGTAIVTAQGSVANERSSAAITVVNPVVHTVGLQPLSVQITAGNSVTLTAMSSDSSDTFAWQSSNSSVASVDSNGVVTGRTIGAAEISVEGTNSGAIGRSNVSVTAPLIHQISVTPSPAIVEIASSVQLTASSTDPADTFTWSSADVTVATVRGNGSVAGVGAGTVEITVTGSSSGERRTVTITVVEAQTHEVTVSPVSSILFTGDSVSLVAESTDVVDSFTWASADTGIATVDTAGTVTGTGEGMVEITATGARSGARGTAEIMVNSHVVMVTPPTLGILAGTTATLSAMSTDTGETIRWTTSDSGIAIVNTSGVVSGVTGGTATITGTGARSGAADTCEVTVVDGVAVNPPSGSVPVGFTLQFSAESTDINDNFNWTTSNTSVAAVSPSGVVTGRAAGSVQIRATGSSSGQSASATISVVPVMAVNPPVAQVAIGRIVALEARLLNIGDTLSWQSSDPNIATVNSAGFVAGASVGTVTITATASPSGAMGFAEVEVLPEFPNALLFNAEGGYEPGNRAVLNTTEEYRGFACLEGIPDQFAGFGFTVRDEFYRQDMSRHDEIWMMIRAQGSGAHSQVNFQSFQGSGAVVALTDYAPGGNIGNQYELVRIPLADLVSEDFDFTRIEQMNFGRREVGENFRFFIDEVWAVNLDSVAENGGPLVGPVRAVEFGGISVMTGATENVQIANLGASTLNVNRISVEGPGAVAFEVSPAAIEVAPGASAAISVTFLPGMAGLHEAALVLSHSKTAFGEETRIPISGNGLSARMELSNGSLDFGSAPLAGSVVRTLTIGNSGNEPLSVSGISSSSGDFTPSASSLTVPPGDSATLPVTALPSVLGNAGGALSFAANDPNNMSVEIPLLMTGLAAGTVGQLPLEIVEVASSAVELNWGEWALADTVRVSIGPEPPPTPGAPLPLSFEVASLPGNASGYTIDNLAAAVDVFIRVEASLLGAPIAVRNQHVKTEGGPQGSLSTKLREVHMFAPDILQLVFADERVHSFREGSDFPDMGIDEVIGYTGPAWQAGSWTVRRADGTEIAVTNVYRHSVPVGAPYYDTGFGALTRDNLLDVDHRIYLDLAENVGSREVLQVTGPSFTYEILNPDLEREDRTASLDVLIPFSDRYLTSTAIQVNQVGYSPAATRRYAYISGWMGDGGPLSLDGYPVTAGVVVESADPLTPRASVLANLPIGLRTELDRDAGTEIRDIDIADLPASEDDTYYVRVPGVGVSWPTRVSELAVFEVFYHTARGLFHNRWAGDLAPEFTDWSRPRDHGNIFTSENLEPFVFFDEDTPRTGERPLLGGHHDAGDFDVRIFHSIVSQMLMRAYELNESAFTDGQLYIPESGNGIPDLLDEALWSVAAWEYLQEEDGGVRIGAESFRHPFGIYFAHEDELPYFTFSREPHFTARCAGIFAQASRLVAPFDPIRAHILRGRAERAYNYAIANGVGDTAGGTLMYGASELYRLTGDEAYREQITGIWDAFRLTGSNNLSLFDRDIPPTKTFTEPVQPITWDHISGYLGSGGVLPVHQDSIGERLNGRPSQLLEAANNNHGHRNARPPTYPLTFGKGVAVGQYVYGAYAGLQYGNLNAAQRQDAFDVMSLSADYTLGCNPEGMSWITGLGSRYPLDPLHLDSLAFIHAGQGAIPGIPVYGPADNLRQVTFYTFSVRLAHPAFLDSPPARRYGDVHTMVVTNEFTVWECQAPVVQLFASLIAPGLSAPEDWLPTAVRETGGE